MKLTMKILRSKMTEGVFRNRLAANGLRVSKALKIFLFIFVSFFFSHEGPFKVTFCLENFSGVSNAPFSVQLTTLDKHVCQL